MISLFSRRLLTIRGFYDQMHFMRTPSRERRASRHGVYFRGENGSEIISIMGTLAWFGLLMAANKCGMTCTGDAKVGSRLLVDNVNEPGEHYSCHRLICREWDDYDKAVTEDHTIFKIKYFLP